MCYVLGANLQGLWLGKHSEFHFVLLMLIYSFELFVIANFIFCDIPSVGQGHIKSVRAKV